MSARAGASVPRASSAAPANRILLIMRSILRLMPMVPPRLARGWVAPYAVHPARAKPPPAWNGGVRGGNGLAGADRADGGEDGDDRGRGRARLPGGGAHRPDGRRDGGDPARLRRARPGVPRRRAR